MSEMPACVRRQFEIRAKLDAIAPLPEDAPVSAAEMARYFAVRAQERYVRMLDPRVTFNGQQIAAMCAEAAAAMALDALAGSASDQDSRRAAAAIRDSLAEGGPAGEWLFEFLGADTAEAVAALADELTEATPASGPADQMITVCDQCLRACCWKGIFMCDDSRDAGTRELSAGTLAIIDREHSDYWDGTYERGLGEKDAAS
jgi:hypothetical protein